MITHPTYREQFAVLDGALDDTVRSHIEECSFCRSRLRDVGPAIDIPLEAMLPRRPIELPSTTNDLPRHSDIWRLAWEDTRELAVVLGTNSEGIVVAPLFDDPDEIADEWTLIFEAGASALDIQLGVDVAHPFTLPMFVFDARIAYMDGPAMRSIENATAAHRNGTRPEGPTGRPHFGQLDPRVDPLGESIEAFAALVAATWVEPETQNTPIDWLALADLGLFDTYRLYELSSGGPPEPHETEAAAQQGFRIGPSPLRSDLVEFLNTPHNSTRLRRRAAQLRRTETNVRREAATTMTKHHLMRAARGGDGSVDWAPLLEKYLRETGG